MLRAYHSLPLTVSTPQPLLFNQKKQAAFRKEEGTMSALCLMLLTLPARGPEFTLPANQPLIARRAVPVPAEVLGIARQCRTLADDDAAPKTAGPVHTMEEAKAAFEARDGSIAWSYPQLADDIFISFCHVRSATKTTTHIVWCERGRATQTVRVSVVEHHP